jgi:DnaJ-class molecular chaperone
MLKRTYYETLGLDRQAPTAEIKSQYRRLAKRYHPDLNPDNPKAAEQFQEVQAAYEVLSDQSRRHEYDAQLNINTEPDFDIGNYRPRTSRPRSYRRYDGRPRQRPRTNRATVKPTQPRSAYLQYSLEVSLPELFKETKRILTIGETFSCSRCHGKGKLEGGIRCERCDGYGFVVSFRPAEIVLPPGLQPGMNIRVALNTEVDRSRLSAPITTNIAVTICLRDSAPFEYRDHQLYTTAKIPATLLGTGGTWSIPAPEGGEFSFKIPAGTTSGTTLTLRKHGLRNGSSQRRGNLLCTVIALT